MKYEGSFNEYFELESITSKNASNLNTLISNELSLLWFQSDNNQIEIDHIPYTFHTNAIICLTEFHTIRVLKFSKAFFLKWNKHFYCVVNHDSEVGCRGILFYGANTFPIIHPSTQDLKTFTVVWKMLEQEMVSNDNLQGEMLQMMLKRILILCTRMYKEQSDYKKIDKKNMNIIREYNILVEQYFREKHTVSEYAALMHKSPKTLSNLFKKLGSKSPLQFIKDRKMLEAKRTLGHTHKTISEIGYDLGFVDVQSFSRFFKKEAGISPSDFRK